MHAYIVLKMESSSPPVSLYYNYLVQAAIYAALPKDMAARVHDEGCMAGNRRFKPFSSPG